MKILIDMNLSPEWVQTFADAGINSVHWSTVGDPRAADRTIMAYALANDYIVFTHDLDFGILLAITQADAPSVIQVRIQNILPIAIGELIISALRQFQLQLETGALITVDSSRSRARILPILRSQQ
jgi:predicted nuclease of predicted toxin-antitoxin system